MKSFFTGLVRPKVGGKRRKSMLAMFLLTVMITGMLLQYLSYNVSKAYDGEDSELADNVTTDNLDDQWMDKLKELKLQGDGSGEDVLAVANSQVGYEAIESKDEEGISQYYSVYGAKYYEMYGPWNTAFATFCLDSAKVDLNAFAVDYDLGKWMDALQKNGSFVEAKEGTPTPGDLVFLKSGDSEEAAYIGIVDSIGEKDGVQTVDVIVGDYEHKVQKFTCHMDDVLGYGTVTKIPETVAIDEEKTAAQAPVVKAANGPVERAYIPQELSTVDSRADGIRLNLFDYDQSRVLDNERNIVDHPIYQSINVDEQGRHRQLLFLGQGEHQKNSRDYSREMRMNVFTDGNGNNGIARQGIVARTLQNGYPVLSTNQTVSLDYLFNPDKPVNGKTVYEDVNHLFEMNNEGYYEYNSDRRYAYYNTNSNPERNFTVYQDTYNDREGNKIGFFPFSPYNDAEQDVGPGKQHFNHHFGLTMDVDFLLGENRRNNGKEIEFKFSGDDDVWVFIDDVLVLDLGGIHRRVEGSINFTNGNVQVSNATDLDNNSLGGRTVNISEIFRQAGKEYDNKDWSQHNLKFYYLERGDHYSNNWIRFNLPTGLQIEKQVSPKDTTWYDQNTKYFFKMYVETAVGSNHYVPYNPESDQFRNTQAFYDNKQNDKVAFDENNVFALKAGQVVHVLNLNANRKYYLEECDINGNIISGVNITSRTGEEVFSSEGRKKYTVSSSKQSILQRPSICFTNKLREEYKDITLEKKWLNYDGSSKNDNLPESILVDLYRVCTDANGNVTRQKDRTITLRKDRGFKETVTHLPVVQGDMTYSYEAAEIKVNGYNTSYDKKTTNEGIVISIVNQEQPFNIKVTKKWFKPDNTPMEKGMPEEIQVTLRRYQKDASGNPQNDAVVDTVKLDVSHDWSYEWNANTLEAYDEHGKPYYYYVEEKKDWQHADSYITTYNNNTGISVDSGDKNITINNTYKYVDKISFPEAGGKGIIMFTLPGMFFIVLLGLVYIVSKMKKGGVIR